MNENKKEFFKESIAETKTAKQDKGNQNIKQQTSDNLKGDKQCLKLYWCNQYHEECVGDLCDEYSIECQHFTYKEPYDSCDDFHCFRAKGDKCR